MNPPFSVIFLTVLIGAGQGLFLTLYIGEIYTLIDAPVVRMSSQMAQAGGVSVIFLLTLGLFSSVFHLGRPERSWRAVTQWRTSWLSREIIVLLFFITTITLWTFVRPLNISMVSMELFSIELVFDLLIGSIAAALSVLLYVCTAMIYASIKFIREWSNPFTVPNYLLLGLASGAAHAVILASYFESLLMDIYVILALSFIVVAMGVRLLSLYQNSKNNRKASMALKASNAKVRQISKGVSDNSSNIYDFFHRTKPSFMLVIMVLFPVLAFVAPFLLIIFGWDSGNIDVLFLAVLVQYVGLLLERWLFFAQVRHPQNVYYSDRF